MMKFVYMVFMIIGTLVSLTSSSWFMVWVGLEMNMMGFIPLVGVKSLIISEGVFKYYLIQSMGSLLMFMVGLVGSLGWGYWMFVYDLMFGGVIIVFLMSLKLGASPFHYWFLSVSESLDWLSLFILMTWQSLAPLGMVVVSGWSVVSVLLIGGLSVIVGGFGGFNQMIMKSLMAYSSLSHLGWMGVLFMLSSWVGFFYYFIYILVSLSVIYYFLGSSYEHWGQFVYGDQVSYIMWGGFCMSLFSLGGLPPFLGFYPSWIGIISIMEFGYLWVVLLYVIIGLMTLYFYLRLGYSWLLGGSVVGFWSMGGGLLYLGGGLFGLVSLMMLPAFVFVM